MALSIRHSPFTRAQRALNSQRLAFAPRFGVERVVGRRHQALEFVALGVGHLVALVEAFADDLAQEMHQVGKTPDFILQPSDRRGVRGVSTSAAIASAACALAFASTAMSGRMPCSVRAVSCSSMSAEISAARSSAREEIGSRVIC